MSREPLWVDDTEVLVRELERLGRGGFSLDTEADSMHHFREKVCLIQISTRSADLLIDPLAGIELDSLGPPLADSGQRKILHGADYDVRMLRRDFDFEIRGLFDTMVAARLTGERAFGLAALLEKHRGIRLDKRFQRADWSSRPLSAPMRAYAIADTRHLEELAGILEAKLKALGREAWAAEEFARLEQLLPRERPPAEEAYLRVKGARRLDRRALAVLRELVGLRDAIAGERDLPRFRVVRDDVLLALSQAAERGPLDPSRFPGLPRSWKSGKLNGSLRGRIDRALQLPEAELPATLQRPRRERDPVLETRVRALCKERDRLAAGLGLESSILASRAVLEQVSRRQMQGEPAGEVPELRRWQREILGPVFERLG